MLSEEFGMVIGAICLVLAIVFFVGKGGGVLRAFEGRNAPAKKEKSPEDERRYQRAFGVFCLVIAACEMVPIILPVDQGVWGLATIVVIVLDLVFITLYLKKNFPEG